MPLGGLGGGVGGSVVYVVLLREETPSVSTDNAARRYRSIYRTDEARFDAAVEDAEHRAAGVVENGEPTEFSHDAYMRAWDKRTFGEFTPEERGAIRLRLGLGVVDA